MHFKINGRHSIAIIAAAILLTICGASIACADVADPSPLRMSHILFAQPELLESALLTVIIEVPVFYLLGYRRFRDCIYFAAVNIISNLLLNESLQYVENDAWYLFCLLLGECLVIALEFTLCIYGIPTQKKRLLLTLLLTNLTSFLAGIAYYYLL